MKQTFRILVFSFCFFSISTQAQHFYARLQTGYHFASSASLDDYYDATASSLSVTYKHRKFNHGTSLQSGLCLGFLFTKNIGFEVGVSKAFRHEIVFQKSIKPSWAGTFTEDFTRSYSSIFIQPALVVRTGYEKLNLYSKLGLLILKGQANTVIKQNNNGTLSEIDYNLKGISGIGYHGALGVLFRLHALIDLQLEINTNNVSGSPKTRTLTRYIEDGQDKLATMDVREKETEFVKEFTLTQSDPSPSEPSKELLNSIPYQNLGFQLGITFKF